MQQTSAFVGTSQRIAAAVLHLLVMLACATASTSSVATRDDSSAGLDAFLAFHLESRGLKVAGEQNARCERSAN